MDNSQKIILAFKKKFDSMSAEKKDQYLADMGLKYEKITEQVPVDPTIRITCVGSKVNHKHNPISGVNIVNLDGAKCVPVHVYADRKKTHGGMTRVKIPLKKVKEPEKAGK